MKILSTNIATPTEIEVNGKTELTGYFKKPIDNPIYIGINGVENDNVCDLVHHGGPDKACYLYGFNHYEFWKKHYPNLEWNYGMFGENITVDYLDESELKIGDVLKLGTAVVQITQPRQPCYKMGIKFKNSEIVQQFRQEQFPGIYVRVISEGFVNKGDIITLQTRYANALSVAEVFKAIYTKPIDVKVIEKIIADKYVAIRLKEYLKKKLN